MARKSGGQVDRRQDRPQARKIGGLEVRKTGGQTARKT
jgi:hypothetical protein